MPKYVYTHYIYIYAHMYVCVCFLKIIAHEFCITFTFLLEMLGGTFEPNTVFLFLLKFSLLWKISNIYQNGENSIATP